MYVISPSPSYSGERVGVRAGRQVALLTLWPLTLTLSPEYGGEGTRAGCNDAHQHLPTFVSSRLSFFRRSRRAGIDSPAISCSSSGGNGGGQRRDDSGRHSAFRRK